MLKPRLDGAMSATSLTPMFEILPQILDVAYLEYASKGSATQTREEIKGLGARARELISVELRRIRHDTMTLEMVANSIADDNRRGLYSTERTRGAETVNYLLQIEQLARDVRRRGTELGFDGSVLGADHRRQRRPCRSSPGTAERPELMEIRHDPSLAPRAVACRLLRAGRDHAWLLFGADHQHLAGPRRLPARSSSRRSRSCWSIPTARFAAPARMRWPRRFARAGASRAIGF